MTSLSQHIFESARLMNQAAAEALAPKTRYIVRLADGGAYLAAGVPGCLRGVATEREARAFDFYTTASLWALGELELDAQAFTIEQVRR